MGGRLDPSVARVRVAVRHALADLEPADLVLVGCSGGADSLALLAAACFEAGHAELLVGAVVVDHALQHGSAEVAGRAARQATELGADPVRVERVVVAAHGGPEGAARSARRAALDRVADGLGAACVLLGHTRDDQAETVLLGLARGSGARSLSGMRPVAARVRRPLLGVSRADTRAACAADGLDWWDDPHNRDRAYARSRVRHSVLPALERGLGPGVSAALARTADLVRADADALDALAARLYAEAGGDPLGLQVSVLAQSPAALRHRALRTAALAAGCPAGDLTSAHVLAIDALITAWHGQRRVDLPGRVAAERVASSVRLTGPV